MKLCASTPWQVVLRRDVLPNSVTFSEEEKRLHEQGADVLFTAGRSDSSIDLLLRSAETMQRCVAYATQTSVFAHALHQVRASPHGRSLYPQTVSERRAEYPPRSLRP